MNKTIAQQISEAKAMTPAEVKKYRSIANQARYMALYIANVQGDCRYLDAISKYYIATENDVQPAIRDIRDYIDSGRDSVAAQCFTWLYAQYQHNASLVNAFITAR